MAYPVSSDDPVVVLRGLAGLGGGGACGGGLLVVPLPGLVWTGSVMSVWVIVQLATW